MMRETYFSVMYLLMPSASTRCIITILMHAGAQRKMASFAKMFTEDKYSDNKILKMQVLKTLVKLESRTYYDILYARPPESSLY